MDFGELKTRVARMPVFSTQDVMTLSGQEPSVVAVALTRWCRAGHLLRLRRGLYALSERDRELRVRAPVVASALVEPSYLSGLWILAQVSIIPEAVFIVTSATRGRRVRFENAFGRFVYERLPARGWFGFAASEVDGCEVLFADAEKALLDYIYWSRSRWDAARFRQERVDAERIDLDRLESYVDRWPVCRLVRAVEEFKLYKEAACLTW